jgi:hypothetical protein
MSREDIGLIQCTIGCNGKAKYDVSRGRVTIWNIIGNTSELSQGAKLN